MSYPPYSQVTCSAGCVRIPSSKSRDQDLDQPPIVSDRLSQNSPMSPAYYLESVNTNAVLSSTNSTSPPQRREAHSSDFELKSPIRDADGNTANSRRIRHRRCLSVSGPMLGGQLNTMEVPKDAKPKRAVPKRPFVRGAIGALQEGDEEEVEDGGEIDGGREGDERRDGRGQLEGTWDKGSRQFCEWVGRSLAWFVRG
ncbi:hypothetical protein MMC28_006724 [Mycoblastus sanguinarius]|nr:hypothetical protein [Mycoblastus sanguinarius]